MICAFAFALSAALALTLACFAWRLRDTRGLVADAVHEIRGPLTAAGLALEAGCRRGAIAPDRAAGVDAQLRRAWRAVEDLAQAPELSRGIDRLEPLAVEGVLAELELAWAPVAGAQGRGFFTAGASSALVLADAVRLGQAAGNLIANAIEHGDGPVELRLRELSGRVRLEVHDAGAGLAEPLVVLSRRAVGSRGRGLRIAAEIAERHGGRLVAAPTSAGATLAIELPAHAGRDDVAR